MFGGKIIGYHTLNELKIKKRSWGNYRRGNDPMIWISIKNLLFWKRAYWFRLLNLQICFTQMSKLHDFQKVLNILNYFQKKFRNLSTSSFSFLQFAATSQQLFFPSCNLQQPLNNRFFLPATCSDLSTTVFSFLQFAATSQQPFFPSCNLQEPFNNCFFLPAICSNVSTTLFLPLAKFTNMNYLNF
jgi:hypothetical protein